MKILKISGKNLASLAGDFCVDFEAEPLASSGLFAISGPTGAGKSTLLDALCLALYDATPRLVKVVRGGTFLPDVGSDTVSAQDPRTLLRRGAAEAHAEVDFVGNDNLRYRARWSVRRSRGKAAGGLQKSAMTLHRLPDLIALGGTKTEVLDEVVLRVGLTFEQFTRAVLLAQNEFSAFLKTEENERGELLETLTGSAIYSAISRRAFERFKAEQTALQQLTLRLAEHTPLALEAREALEQQCAAADAALALAEARSAELDKQLRWQHEAARLQQGEAQAADALAQAQAAVDAAAGQWRRVKTLDAVQPARQLVADSARLETEIDAGRQAIDAAAVELARASAAQEQAAGALALAGTRLQAAEQAQRAAAPQLDQAKALDASIGALAPSHAKAMQALQVTQQELAAAAQALESKSADLAALTAAQSEGAEWLARHQDREPLAAQWPRWETLLLQSEQAGAQRTQLAAELAAAHAALQAASASELAAGAALAQSKDQQTLLEDARQQAIAALAAFDTERIRRQREALDERRDALAKAETAWREWSSVQARLAQVHAQRLEYGAASTGASAALAAAAAQAGALAAALAQAERSLQAAETACAGSVVDLRATLADGERCPVCGSESHPYHDQSAVLDNMLASLRTQVAQQRRLVQDNLALQATQRALLAASERQRASAQADAEALAAAHERAAAAWQQASAIAQGQEPARLASWFGAELAAAKAASLALDASEGAARAAAAQRDAAQQACDQGAASHARAQEAATSARAALARAQAAHDGLAAQHVQAAGRISALLTELEAAFGAGGWQQSWEAGPAAFRAERDAEARAWRERSAQQSGRSAQLAALQAQLAAAQHRLGQAQQFQAAAGEEFARVDSDIGAKKSQRTGLWDGRPASDIEAALAAAIDGARTALAREHSALQLAAQAETRARESVSHNTVRVEALTMQAAQAAARVADWLLAFAGEHPDLEPVAGRATLDTLLAIGQPAIALERAALQTIEAAAASAATVLAERRSQRARHLEAAPPGDPVDEAAVAQAAAQRKLAHDTVSALRLQLAQDDVRRTGAATMMAQIEKQQLVELRWGRMNELIGSSDGKKFRNYAQQFTLDVLLGYANSHLGHLAKRYRLERVAAASGPSLGLLVRDQDMGGEIRSVNSLSGGESFLVSLALALGLASLSSNRVRVESLFIDEGFGSLDADTLRVAMDALDGLQSMGRKVGVISHVQEMTERIATRILVQPAGGGTSSVTVQ